MLEIKISLQDKQLEALNKSYQQPVTFYGGQKGGGKSYLVRAREILRRLEFPKTTGSIIRKTFPELRANHIVPFFQEYPQLKSYYNKADKAIYYPNGSVTTFNHLQYTDDVYNYQGIALDDISIDEITQHEEDVFRILRSSNRRSISDPECKIVPTMFLTGNPGGIGHQFIKRLFIDKEFREGEKASDFLFIRARIQDNPALLKADPGYISRLEALPEQQRRAYLEGDWNIFAGLAFPELSRDVHLIEPFILDDSFKLFAGYDYGYNHPFAFVLFALKQDGDVYVVDYLKDRLKRPDEQAYMILEKIKNYSHIYISAGTDIWAKKDGRRTVMEEMDSILKSKGSLIKAYTNREDGVAQIRKVLAYIGTPTGKPKLKIFRTCQEVFDVIKEQQFNERKPEDVIKMDADENGEGGDDLFEAFRYGIMQMVRPVVEKKIINPNSGEELLRLIEQQRRTRSTLKGWR